MRVNVYAEEITDRVELVSKSEGGHTFVGLRFYLELPVTLHGTDGAGRQVSGPFLHRQGDDDSAAVTFWGRAQTRAALEKGLALLEAYERARTGGVS